MLDGFVIVGNGMGSSMPVFEDTLHVYGNGREGRRHHEISK